jgi:hypothetical protein
VPITRPALDACNPVLITVFHADVVPMAACLSVSKRLCPSERFSLVIDGRARLRERNFADLRQASMIVAPMECLPLFGVESVGEFASS